MDKTTTVHDSNRVVFMDNLRFLMVLLVVVLHASVGYTNLVPWWAVRDNASVIMDMVLVGLDVFLMPVLFFIGGYFGLSSIRRHGGLLFLKKKFKRLGIPLLISAPITGCLFAYMHHYTRGSLGVDAGLWSHWKAYISTALNFHVGQIPAINHFSHSHLWFMSVLLFFFIVFALIRTLGTRNDQSGQQEAFSATTSKRILLAMTIVGLGSTLTTIAGTFMFARPENPEPWFIIANLLQFQPHKLAMYGLYFVMGVYAHRTQWFSIGRFPGNMMTWSILSVSLLLAMLMTLKQMMTAFSPSLLLTWLLIRSFCCLSILAALLTFAIRRWNRPNKPNKLLAVNSYHVYILHFIVVLIFQLLLSQWPEGSVLIKFCIVSVLSILTSIGLSHYIFRPYPVWSVVGVMGIFSIALAIFRPLAT